jgi:anaerobic magnesium-protoporphyrin IX monomethyl ester cyclase
MKKILFITPPYHCGVVEVAGRWLPPQFVYLGAAAREAGWMPILYDAMGMYKSHEDIVKQIEEHKPDVVATSSITATLPEAVKVLDNAKKVNPGIVTVIGGGHTTFMYEETLREHASVDYIVMGEGEITLEELLRCLDAGGDPFKVLGLAYRQDGGVVTTPPRPRVKDLDSLGRAWDLIEWNKYTYFVYPGSRLGIINTSRGCQSNCTFCSQRKFWEQSWRHRSVESVVREVRGLHRKFQVDTILLGDEYPTASRKHWERLLDALIAENLPIRFLMETRIEDIVRDKEIMWKYKKAGFVHIYVGVEATDQETLDLIQKDLKVGTSKQALDILHSHGIVTETSFILGFPHETPDTVKRTLELSQWYNPDFAHYLAITPWPYADLYADVKDDIVIKDYSKYNLIEPIIKPKNMTLEQIDRAILECYRDFYMGKMKEVLTLDDAHKKDYILRSMKLIMASSFITEKLASLANLPADLKAAMKALAKPKPGPNSPPPAGAEDPSCPMKEFRP